MSESASARILVVDWAGLQLRVLVDKSRFWAPGDRVSLQLDEGRCCWWPRS